MLFYRVIWKDTRTKCCRASVSEERLNFVIVILWLRRTKTHFSKSGLVNKTVDITLIQPTISLEMPVPSQGHYGLHSFPVVD